MKLLVAGALFLGFMLAGCAPAEPRSQQYFETPVENARKIAEECRDGSVRGGECDNADRAIRRVEAKERQKRFFGDGKAYTPD